jgi:hypothetical protein
MPTDYNILRNKMLSLLCGSEEFSLPAVKLTFSQQGIELDQNDIIRIEQIFHEFYFDGILVPGPIPKPNATYQGGMLVFPKFHLTEYGKKVLKTTEYQPHDPDGYLAKIKTDIPSIDSVIVRYLEESLSCFKKNLLLAAAVMLGCAAEKCVLLLIETFGDTLTGGDRTTFERETSTFVISRKYNALWSRLETMTGSLPANISDNLHNKINGIFEIIRTTRNDAGHPSGNIIEKETVHANLLLFPIFCKRIYELIQHFSP